MSDNKWFYSTCWILSGLLCAENALHYFISGESFINSSLRNFLVTAQFLFGIWVTIYGFKLYWQRSGIIK